MAIISPKTQKKQITVQNLSQRVINYLDKVTQQQKSFILYQIQATDGLVYETGNLEYFNKKKVGESLNIEYVVQAVNKNGVLYTNYRIILPRFSEVLEGLKQRIEILEQKVNSTPDIPNETINKELEEEEIEEEIPF